MKKLTALLMALLMVATMMTTAMAEPVEDTTTELVTYDQVVFPTNTTLKHTLALRNGLDTLPYDITYKFENVGGIQFVNTGFVTTEGVAYGSPTIAEIKYEALTTPDAAKTYSRTLSIDWSDVVIKEPGVYRWQFHKKPISADPKQDNLSNEVPDFYLYATVTIENGKLTAAVRMSSITMEDDVVTDTKMGTGDGSADINDSYPQDVLNLTLGKEVSGNQASRNQYFKFTVQLKAPTGAAEITYDIDYSAASEEVPATAYNAATTNPKSITVKADAWSDPLTLWLKAGEKVTIPGLLYNTGYQIVETVPADYQNVSIGVVGDSEVYENEAPTIVDNSLKQSTTVTYTNTKDAPVPTGIDLQTSAPIFGLLMAMAMMFMAFVGKRKEQMN